MFASSSNGYDVRLWLSFIPHTRTARRIEDSQQTQLIRAHILNAMHLAFWQIDARAGRNRRVGFAGPHTALATQDEEHFFVWMKMIRRAAGRNRAHKLGGVSTTDLIVDQHSVPTICCGLGGTI